MIRKIYINDIKNLIHRNTQGLCNYMLELAHLTINASHYLFNNCNNCPRINFDVTCA